MEVKYNKYLDEAMEQLAGDGIFLTVKNDAQVNTMTIGWGFAGIMWNKPVFIAAVRYSRHTYEILEDADEFTVSIPLKGQMKEELIKCGTKSGRDYDKFKEFNIKTDKSLKLETPVIKDCDLHYECKIIYRQTLEAELIKNKDIKAKYKNHDYHVMIYGEIVSCHK
ncbi:MAG: flavin reductase family protein [Bacillota bacterium]|nr:flavin reductase family protein [Bacillota bacterium]